MARAVLIVDDEQHIRLLIEQTLEELLDEGVELYTAADGDEALAAIAAQRPDLVFLDVMMPGRSGLDVCRAVRADPELAGAHIVLLTAKGQAQDREPRAWPRAPTSTSPSPSTPTRSSRSPGASWGSA